MAARTNPTGEWCSPTREITSSQLIHLLDESRRREVVVEMIQEQPLATAQEVAVPDPCPATFWLEPEAEQATATPTHAPMTANAMPPTAAPAQTIATGARRGRKRTASVRLLLGLGVLVSLCLGVLVFLGLGVTGASIYASLGL